MTNTVSGVAAFALLTFAAITPSVAADPYAPPPVQNGATMYEGMPCPGIVRNGRQAHYVWEQAYAQKGKWEYQWTCEF